MSSTSAMNGFILPPWGAMDRELVDEIRDFEIPDHWQAVQAASDREEAYQQWRRNVVDEIHTLIWPRYVVGSRGWDESAVAAVTEVDFALLRNLHAYLEQPISANTSVLHVELFAEEDEGDGLGVGYERYDPQMPRTTRMKLRELMLEGIGKKVGSIGLQLKQVFQRPRPYQVAFLQGRGSFKHVFAASAATPSLVSGHCLQGTLAICHVYAALRQQVSSTAAEQLAQYMVDIGDRRVFAGVHYPSDNLSSWLTALRLIPHVFDCASIAAVQSFLLNAILTRSIVFRDIRQNATTANSPYATIVQLLERMSAPATAT